MNVVTSHNGALGENIYHNRLKNRLSHSDSGPRLQQELKHILDLLDDDLEVVEVALEAGDEIGRDFMQKHGMEVSLLQNIQRIQSAAKADVIMLTRRPFPAPALPRAVQG